MSRDKDSHEESQNCYYAFNKTDETMTKSTFNYSIPIVGKGVLTILRCFFNKRRGLQFVISNTIIYSRLYLSKDIIAI